MGTYGIDASPITGLCKACFLFAMTGPRVGEIRQIVSHEVKGWSQRRSFFEVNGEWSEPNSQDTEYVMRP